MGIGRALLALTMITGVMGGTLVSSAEAGDGCSANRACLFGNNDFKWKLSERAAGYGISNITGSRNDEMDSWVNLTRTNAAGYEHANGAGDCLTFRWGSRDNNVAFFNSDEVSSWRTNRGC